MLSPEAQGLPLAKTNPDNLFFVKVSATKPLNKTIGEAFAARFRGFALRARAVKLLKPPSYAGYKSFCTIHEFEQTMQQTKLKTIQNYRN